MRPGVEALRGLPLLRSFDLALLGTLNELADLARIGPGEVLFHQGDRTEELNILVSGYVAAVRSTSGGDALTDVIAPVRALAFATTLLGLPAAVGAKTVTSSRLILIPAPELRELIAMQPQLGLPFLDYALNELNELTLDVCQLKLRSAAQRLAEYLLSLIEKPELTPVRFVLPYEKRFLAGKIGCSRENLSRAFTALRRVGVVTHQGIVVVRDVATLRDFAGHAPPEAAGTGTERDRLAQAASARAVYKRCFLKPE